MIDRKATILVIDDSEINRTVLCEFLVSIGHSVTVAENGEAGLDQLKETTAHVILLDVMMPVMNGIEFLEKVKNTPHLSSIPVIMLSGSDETDDVVKCIQIGAEDFLTKPFNPTLLKTRISGCLEKQNALREARKLGQYRLKQKISEGGMSEIYMASHLLLRRPTAIKLLSIEKASALTVSMFEKEAQLTSSLSHPNTIVIYDYGRTPDGLFYYAMEYLNGFNLRQLIKSNGPVSEKRALHILLQVVSSLEEAHSVGLVHRDIKPANIMLCNQGGIYDFVKVLDWGIVKKINELVDDKELKTLYGTPQFASPEAISSPKEVDTVSDLYCIGALAYYLTTGEFVFDEWDLESLLFAKVTQNPIPLSKLDGVNISEEFESIVLQCLNTDKAQRPQSATELRKLLGKCQKDRYWTHANAEKNWNDCHEKIVGATVLKKRRPTTISLFVDVAKRLKITKTGQN